LVFLVTDTVDIAQVSSEAADVGEWSETHRTIVRVGVQMLASNVFATIIDGGVRMLAKKEQEAVISRSLQGLVNLRRKTMERFVCQDTPNSWTHYYID
jgi:hypothetical protein